MFSAQYQQSPVPLEGNLIRREWFRFHDRPPQADPTGWIVQSWDIATMTGEATRLLQLAKAYGLRVRVLRPIGH